MKKEIKSHEKIKWVQTAVNRGAYKKNDPEKMYIKFSKYNTGSIRMQLQIGKALCLSLGWKPKDTFGIFHDADDLYKLAIFPASNGKSLNAYNSSNYVNHLEYRWDIFIPSFLGKEEVQFTRIKKGLIFEVPRG